MHRRPIVLLALVAVLAGAGPTACGGDEGPTALAVRFASWTPDGDLVVSVECSRVESATIEPGAGVDGLPLVTVWGRPKLGRCRERVVLAVPDGTTRINDAATGTVVDLPAP